MTSIRLEVKGFKELAENLATLPQRSAKKALASAIQKGASTLAKRARKTAPVKFGILRASINAKRIKSSPLSAVSETQVQARYGKLVEKGHKWVVSRKGKVYASGTVGPQPYLRPAFDTNVFEIIKIIGEQLGKSITREFSKLG